MASSYHSSQAYITPPDSQINIYGAQHTSPPNSISPTPTNVSPTSPRAPALLSNLPLATRQLRPLKTPMYVPAVLRPTERPYRPSPLTPPRSMHGSTDSLDGAGSFRPPSRQPTSDPATDDTEQPIVDEMMPEEDLGNVTGTPTRDHWKPDANAVICDAPMCYKTFNLFERRHHCRHCGHVFCNTHSHYIVPLDQDAEFHPNGFESRACKHCWERYRSWKAHRSSRTNSISSSITAISASPAIGIGRVAGNRTGSDGPKLPAAASVPRDWNWSTF
ncbi:MAG: hypothetical protein Q9187_003828 [Circinaria calcarea]